MPEISKHWSDAGVLWTAWYNGISRITMLYHVHQALPSCIMYIMLPGSMAMLSSLAEEHQWHPHLRHADGAILNSSAVN